MITSALSAAFSALAIYRAGAVPRFVDVDPATLQIDPAPLEVVVGEKTRAILPVHLYGQACDLERIGEPGPETRPDRSSRMPARRTDRG